MNVQATTANQVTIEINSLPQIVVGEAVELNLTIINQSGETYIVDANGYFIDCQISVVDSNGSAAPYTVTGEGFFGGERMEGSGVLLQIAPGETMAKSVNLEKMFDFEPKSYQLSLNTKMQEFDGENFVGDQISLTVSGLSFSLVPAKVNPQSSS